MAIPPVLETIVPIPSCSPTSHSPVGRTYWCETTRCGRKWSCIDYLFALGECSGGGLLLIGGSAYALKASAVVSVTGGLGGGALLAMSILGHVTWRRAKPLLNVNDAEIALRNTNESLNNQVVTAGQHVDVLTHTVVNLDQMEDRVREGADQANDTHQQLIVAQRQLEIERAAYQTSEQSLRAENEKLRVQSAQLTTSLKEMNVYLRTLHEKSSALKKQVELGAGLATALDEEQRQIAQGIERFKTHVDPAIASLAQHVQSAHEMFEEIVRLQEGQKTQLQRQVDQFHADVEALRAVDQHLESRKRAVQELIDQESTLSKNIAALEAHLLQLNTQFQRSSQIALQLQRTEVALHRDGEELTSIQAGLSDTLAQLENLLSTALEGFAQRGGGTS